MSETRDDDRTMRPGPLHDVTLLVGRVSPDANENLTRLADGDSRAAGGAASSSADRSTAIAPDRAGQVEGSDCATCDGLRLVDLVLCDACAQMAAAGIAPTRACGACVTADCPACRPVPIGERGE
jgi:hypothetical protein